MKKLVVLLLALTFLYACKDKTEVKPDPVEPLTNLVLTVNSSEIGLGETFVFTTVGSNGKDLTDSVVYYINGEEIASNQFTATERDVYRASSKYLVGNGSVLSNALDVKVIKPTNSTSITVFDQVTFYNSYADPVTDTSPSNIVKLSNTRYATKLSTSQLSSINSSLSLDITLKAACDNYDRIGNVVLSLVNKGKDYSSDDIVKSAEVGRFITPFMNKNDSDYKDVDFSIEASNLVSVLTDATLNEQFDFWVVFFIGGVSNPSEVSGCDGDPSTFFGTLELVTGSETVGQTGAYFLPIANYQRLNNYADTDVSGETEKTISFTTDKEVNNAKLYLITSNHGANSGGEEYIRREHFIYFDDNQIGNYIPGGKSCEPYRQYNSQSNGIYTTSPRSTETWLSFNNWCPGDKVPIRTYELGSLTAGEHTFKIEVPDAFFAGGQGNIPFSVYLQGE